MKALCHPVRLCLVALLAEHEPLSVKDMQEALDLSQSNVSQHLRKLEKAGLIGMEKTGNFSYYRIIHPKIGRLLACADQCACPEEMFETVS